MDAQIKSQKKKILEHLQQGKSITPLEALFKFGCYRLGARIYDLRQQQIPIKMDLVTENEKTYAKYYLQNE